MRQLNKISLAIATFFVASAGFAQETQQNQPSAQVEQRVEAPATALVSRYPIANRERPFTLPSQVAEFVFKVGNSKFRNFSASAGLSYGVTDWFQLNASYEGVSLNNFKEIKAGQAFHVGPSFDLYGTPYAAAMLDIDLPLYIDRDVLKQVNIAMPTAFPIHKGLGIGLMTLHEDLIEFTWKPTLTASVNLPARISWQATQNFWFGVGTNLATFSFGQDATGKKLEHGYIWTRTPLRLDMLYAFNNAVDLIAKVGFTDVQTPRDSFTASLAVAYRFGKLFG